jgi:hypothetical protein
MTPGANMEQGSTHRVVSATLDEVETGSAKIAGPTGEVIASGDESQPPPAGTPESARWWRRKHLSDAKQALLEAPPEAKIGLANFALCLAIAAVMDVLGPSPAPQVGSEDSLTSAIRTYSIHVNGREYEFTNLEFPEYGEVTAVASRQMKLLENKEQPVEVPTLDSDLERQVLHRVDQALGFISE